MLFSGLKIRGKKIDDEDKRVCIGRLLKMYGLESFIWHPRQLSGGMRQKSSLIRTLALKPDILLFI